jgi:anti-sigma28 factor (negative regulator of flagellin synthesis)
MRLQLDTSTAAPGTSPGSVAGLATGTALPDAAARPRTGSSDSISFSAASTALARASVDRAGRIAKLTAAVRSGSYQVRSPLVAASIVRQSAAQAGG